MLCKSFSTRVARLFRTHRSAPAVCKAATNYVLVFSSSILDAQLANILEPQRGINTSTQGRSVQLLSRDYSDYTVSLSCELLQCGSTYCGGVLRVL